MKWSKGELLRSNQAMIHFDEVINLDTDSFARSSTIRGLNDISVVGDLRYDHEHDEAICDLHIEGDMILACARSLQDVIYHFETSSTEIFAFKESDNPLVHVCKKDQIELIPVLFPLIMMEEPLKVVKDGSSCVKGNGWEVIIEQEDNKNIEKSIDPRLAKLKNFKFED